MIQPKTLPTLLDVSDKYQNYVVDIWGVIHNGVKVFPEAEALLRALKKKEKTICLLTNSPRLPEDVKDQLKNFGLDLSLIDGLWSSGGQAQTLLHDWIREEGPFCFFMGKEIHKGILIEAGATPVDDPEIADFIYNSGPSSIAENFSQHQRNLEKAQAAGLKMFCTNPDIMVLHGSEQVYCAGSLGQLYKNLGGEVVYAGKPYSNIYEILFAQSGTKPSQTLCVGDSMAHDIKGGWKQGCDTALVLSGVEAQHLTPETLAAGFEDKYGFGPTYILDSLR